MAEEGVPSIASQLCLQCTEMFKALLSPLLTRKDVAKATVKSYRQSCTSFILWVDGYDAHKGGLDRQLNASSSLRRTMYRLLVGLCDLATENLVCVLSMSDSLQVQVETLREVSGKARMDVLDLESDDSSTNSSIEGSGEEYYSLLLSTQPSLDDILEDFANYVKCLSDLAPLITASTSTAAILDKGKAPDIDRTSALIWWKSLQHYKWLIRSRYPDTPDHLVERLGKANLARFQRLQEAKETPLPASTEHVNRDGTQTIAGKSLIDSGLGSSIDTRSTRASTLMQYAGKYSDPVNIPELPEGARSGKPFDCVACGHKISVRTGRDADRDWKKHLFQDLRPWVCVGPVGTQCDDPYLSREDWTHHLASFHLPETTLTAYHCPFCQEKPGPAKTVISQHLAGHLEEIALSAFLSDVDDVDADGHTDKELEKLQSERTRRWLHEDPAEDSKHGVEADGHTDGEPLEELESGRLKRWLNEDTAGDSKHPETSLDDLIISEQHHTALGSETDSQFELDNRKNVFGESKSYLPTPATSSNHQHHMEHSSAPDEKDKRVFICKCGMTSTRKDNFRRRHLNNCRELHLPSDKHTCVCGFQSKTAEAMEKHFTICSGLPPRGRPDLRRRR